MSKILQIAWREFSATVVTTGFIKLIFGEFSRSHQMRAAEVSVSELGPLKGGPFEFGACQVGLLENSGAEVSLLEFGNGKVGLLEIAV